MATDNYIDNHLVPLFNEEDNYRYISDPNEPEDEEDDDAERGRPLHKPTPTSYAQVRDMAAIGITQEKIALVLHISPKTLRKHYREELDCSAIRANWIVGKTLFEMATSGRCPSATIFWTKTRILAPASEVKETKETPAPSTANKTDQVASPEPPRAKRFVLIDGRTGEEIKD